MKEKCLHSMNLSAVGRPVALSLTGSGHLLVYQLGVCRTLLQQQLRDEHQFNITHIVGASGGAIAAAVVTHIPDHLDDYAHAFIQKRGGGLQLLREEFRMVPPMTSSPNQRLTAATLHIATTRCIDGQGCLFPFAPSDRSRDGYVDDMMRCLEASCLIPPTFHPWDALSSAASTYPEEHGISLSDNAAHVDGGIAFPAPPTPGTCRRVIVSPLSGTSNHAIRISPGGGTTRSHSRQGWRQVLEMTAKDDLGIDVLSWSNLRALRAATGLVTSAELLEWYERGQEDASEQLFATGAP